MLDSFLESSTSHITEIASQIPEDTKLVVGDGRSQSHCDAERHLSGFVSNSSNMGTAPWDHRHGCQMAVAKFLDCMCLAIRALSTMAQLRSASKFDPFLYLDCGGLEGGGHN